MPRDPLPPDPESEEAWRNMPQTPPSKQALPPATGGLQMTRALVFIFLLAMAIVTIISLIAGRG